MISFDERMNDAQARFERSVGVVERDKRVVHCRDLTEDVGRRQIGFARRQARLPLRNLPDVRARPRPLERLHQHAGDRSQLEHLTGRQRRQRGGRAIDQGECDGHELV